MLMQPVILSGGSGTRLWPLSREAYPKQFLPLTSQHTMLQETVRRLDGLDNEHPRCSIGLLDPIVVCNDAHRFLVAEQMRVLDRSAAGIVLEPKGRNTAPALTLAALVALRAGDDPVLLAMPADHTIRNETAFRAAVADGFALARDGAVVTFGIVPSKPETGYGYIRQGDPWSDSDLEGRAFRLSAFVEKPDLDTAKTYLESGAYLWNSGLFALKASLWMSLIERFRPDIVEAVRRALDQGHEDDQFVWLDSAAFAACPSDSIDYAVMERLATAPDAPPAVVIPLDIGWSDVGAWSALWEVREDRKSVV